MPGLRAAIWIGAGVMTMALAGCVIANTPEHDEFMRLPREIRSGAAEMVITPAEADVARDEVAAAVQAQLEHETMCFPWPGVWLDPSDRRHVYFARFDLMTRDWGDDVASASRLRMQEMVDLGFLTARERPDIGAGVIEYNLTDDGEAYLRGSPYGGARPSFCAPSQRRLVDIIAIEPTTSPCGALRVRFTHIGDDWPHWARTESARERITQAWGAPGAVGGGFVSLNRQWFRPNQVPAGAANGQLRSLCYDRRHHLVTGEDLDLSPAPIAWDEPIAGRERQ